MTLSENIEAAAFFGSHVRGDNDELSDKDILLIGDDRHRVPCRRQAESRGYSPSFYSWGQFEELVLEKSIFIQHLKQEGVVIRDRNQRLASLLRSFSPASEYAERLSANRSLLLLTTGVPQVPGAIGWAFDVLAVGLRNFAVLENAQRGHFIFSYSTLVRELELSFRLSPMETSLLLSLRREKAEYRSATGIWHQHDLPASYAKLIATQALVYRIAGLQMPSDHDKLAAFARARLMMIDSHHWYVRLRSYEGAYRALAPPTSNSEHCNMAEIEKLIANPSPYGPRRIDAIEKLRELVGQLTNSEGINAGVSST